MALEQGHAQAAAAQAGQQGLEPLGDVGQRGAQGGLWVGGGQCRALQHHVDGHVDQDQRPAQLDVHPPAHRPRIGVLGDQVLAAVECGLAVGVERHRHIEHAVDGHQAGHQPVVDQGLADAGVLDESRHRCVGLLEQAAPLIGRQRQRHRGDHHVDVDKQQQLGRIDRCDIGGVAQCRVGRHRAGAGGGRAQWPCGIDVVLHPHAQRPGGLDQRDGLQLGGVQLDAAHLGQRHAQLDHARVGQVVLGDADVFLAQPGQGGQRPQQRAGGGGAGGLKGAAAALAQLGVGLVRSGESGGLRVGHTGDAQDRPVDHAHRVGRHHPGRAGHARGNRCLDRQVAALQGAVFGGLVGHRRGLAGGQAGAGGDGDIGRRRAAAAEQGAAGGRQPAPPRSADQRGQLLQIAATRSVEKGRLVDRLQLARQHRVLARKALGQQPGDAAGVAVGELRVAALVLVVDEEDAAGVGQRGAGLGRQPGQRLVGTGLLEIGAGPESRVLAVHQAMHPHGGRQDGAGCGQPERRVLGQVAELLTHLAAGQRGQQVIDKLGIGFGGVGHAETSSENGSTRFSGAGWPSTRTVRSMRTLSRGGWCSGRTCTSSTRSMRGSSRSACST